MARFEIEGSDLHLAFGPWEVLGGLRTGARVSLADVSSIEAVDDPWSVLSGMRVGTGVPWLILLGTMVRFRGNDVVAVYGQKPAVVVTLREGARWQRLIATVPDARRIAADLEAAVLTGAMH